MSSWYMFVVETSAPRVSMSAGASRSMPEPASPGHPHRPPGGASSAPSALSRADVPALRMVSHSNASSVDLLG